MEVQGKDMMEGMDWANSRYNEFQGAVWEYERAVYLFWILGSS